MLLGAKKHVCCLERVEIPICAIWNELRLRTEIRTEPKPKTVCTRTISWRCPCNLMCSQTCLWALVECGGTIRKGDQVFGVIFASQRSKPSTPLHADTSATSVSKIVHADCPCSVLASATAVDTAAPCGKAERSDVLRQIPCFIPGAAERV